MDYFDILLAKKLSGGGGGDVEVESLTATENGTYNAGAGKAYNPVVVAVPEPTLITKSITENGTYNASDDNADGYSSVTVDVEGYQIKNIPNVPADIASFNDGTDLPMPSLVIGIEPVQDLHGYDSPWVGGAGKNKLPSISQTQTINGVTWTLQSDGSIKLSGTATANSVYDFGRAENLTLKSGSYFANENGTNYTVTIFRVVGGSASAYKSGGGAFSVSEDTEIFMRITVPSGATINETLYPMIESGSARTTYEPYSNICPISGWDKVNVSRTGKNKITSIIEGMDLISATGDARKTVDWYVSDYSRVEYGKTYYVSGTSSSTVCYYDRYKNFTRNTLSQRTITPQEGECYVRINSLISGYSEPQIEEGNEATSFSPFGQTITIDLDGTRYGGTLDVVSGVLTLTHEIADLPNLSWGKSTATANIYFYVLYTSGANGTYNEPATNVMSNIYITKSRISVTNTQETVGISAEANALYIADGRFNDYTVAQFKEAMSDVQLLLPLATPLTVQLTPTQIKSLLGQNNVFVDSGQIISGQYFAEL